MKTSGRPELSLEGKPKRDIKARKVAFLVADGVDDASLAAMKSALLAEGAVPAIVAPRLGFLTTAKGAKVKIDFSLLSASSVLFDAVFVPGGAASASALTADPDAIRFVAQAYKHGKTVAAVGEGVEFLVASAIPSVDTEREAPAVEKGFVRALAGDGAKAAREFIKAIAEHRFWSRKAKPVVPA